MKTETCGSTGISLAIPAYYWVASGWRISSWWSERKDERRGQSGDDDQRPGTLLPMYFLPAPLGIFHAAQEWIEHYGSPRRRSGMRRRDRHWTITTMPSTTLCHIKVRLTRIDQEVETHHLSDPTLGRLPHFRWGLRDDLGLGGESEKTVQEARLGQGTVGSAGDEYWYGDSDKVILGQTALETAKQAYDMAGIKDPRRELDVAEVYNPFTFMNCSTMNASVSAIPAKPVTWR